MECGPSLAAHALLELFDVGNAVLGILSSGLETYLRYQKQTGQLPFEAASATARAAGQAMELRGTVLQYEGVESGNPLSILGGWSMSQGGRAMNLAGDAGDVLVHGVDVDTTLIPDAVLDRGAEKVTTQTLTAWGTWRAFSVGAEVKVVTERFANGMVRVSISIEADGGLGARRLAKALGLEAGLTAGTTLYWDLADEASADRLKGALAMVLAGRALGGPVGAAVAGAALRLPPPRGVISRTGGYVEGQAGVGPLEVEGRAERALETTTELGEDGTMSFQPAIDFQLAGEGEIDLPFFPAEVSAGGVVNARLEFDGAVPDRIEIVVTGEFETDVSFGPIEAGAGSAYEAKLFIDLGDLWTELGPDVKRVLDDPSRADDLVRRALAVGKAKTTAVLSIYTSNELEADLIAGEYQQTTRERIARHVLHEAE